MKLGPVINVARKNMTSKNVSDETMSANCDVIDILPISGKFGAIQKPYYGRIVCKTYIFINSNLLSYKN